MFELYKYEYMTGLSVDEWWIASKINDELARLIEEVADLYSFLSNSIRDTPGPFYMV